MSSVGNYPTPPTTGSGGTLDKAFKKVHAALINGFNFMSEEWAMTSSLKNFSIDVSAREMIVPIDLNLSSGVASINDMGMEAIPSTPVLDEAVISYINLNKRLIVSDLSRTLDEKHSKGQVTKTLAFSGKKALEALAADYSDRFYGQASGALALVAVDTAVPSAGAELTVSITSPYGSTSLGAGTTRGYIRALLRSGDRIAFIAADGASVVTYATVVTTSATAFADSGGFARIQVSVLATNGVAVATGIRIVKANATQIGAAALPTTPETDFNKSLTGLMSIVSAGSLHNLTHENWTAETSSSAGALTGTRMRFITDTIENRSGKKADRAVISQGVYRNLVSTTVGALRYADIGNMETIGDVKAGSLKWHKTRRVPPGTLIVYPSDCLQKLDVSERPDAPGVSDLRRMMDRSAHVASLDFNTALVCTCRAGFFGAFSLTESDA